VKDFKHATIAEGWYQIGWSEDFQPGELRTLAYFDADLVATRDKDGVVHMMDAICAHLGAHLGYGGKVEDGCIVCPFHGWQWNLDGSNVAIPYSAQRRMEGLRQRTWPVCEQDGLVFAWHGSPSGEPTWSVPRLRPDDGRDWFRLPSATRTWRDLQIVPQVVSENSVDASHFVYVHGAQEVPVAVEHEDRGAVFYTQYEMEFGAKDRPTWATPNGPVSGTITNWCYGVGITLTILEAFDVVVDVAATTPVTHGVSDHRATVWVAGNRKDGSEVDAELRARWAKQQFEQIAADFVIMEHLSYRVRPALAREEIAATRALRKWADRLYPPASAMPDNPATGMSA
jgi:phenylpropionate dioxygenase-like ring-hydroxylating dioxygenase large terminal subunit